MWFMCDHYLSVKYLEKFSNQIILKKFLYRYKQLYDLKDQLNFNDPNVYLNMSKIWLLRF